VRPRNLSRIGMGSDLFRLWHVGGSPMIDKTLACSWIAHEDVLLSWASPVVFVFSPSLVRLVECPIG